MKLPTRVTFSASPISASRSASACSAFMRSVMSRAIFDAPTTLPCAFLSGETEREILTNAPSLRTRVVSKCSMRSPRTSRSRRFACSG